MKPPRLQLGPVLVLLAAVLLANPAAAARLAGQTFEAARGHWAYQPIRSVPPPAVRDPSQVKTAPDAFLLAHLEAGGLSYAPPAAPATILRRVHYDLVGLPPTAEESASFERESLRDPQAALAAVVDRLLASPRYGERWGRHWLDVARYAETKDLVLVYGKDALRPYAYTYRDYVIRAFNEDLPFDQFIRDQLAADLVGPELPAWRLAALGYLTLGRLFDNNVHDQIDDQIDTVSRGLLGLTVACARCHDHKYDAITAADYYGLYGVFASTERPYVMPLIEDPADVVGGAEFESQLAKARQELEAHLDRCFRELTESLRQRIGDYLVRAVTTPPDLTETTQFGLSLTPDDFRPTVMQRTRRFVERRATPEDSVFGPWAVLMAQPDGAFPLAGDGLHRLLAREATAPRGPEPAAARWNPRVLAALSQSVITNRAAVARIYGELFRQVHEAANQPAAEYRNPDPDELALREIVTGKDGPVWFDPRETPIHLSRPDADKYGGLVQNLDKLAAHATNAPPARAMVVRELPEPCSPRIFVRGSPARPGEPVPRSFLRVLNGGLPQPLGEGSGRLALAQAITSPTNPLTARVFVNRVWMEHFGEPLVSSPADFGVRSDPPTHPDLLDWLAGEFIRSGWSVKHLHRILLLSAAFQQGSAAPGIAGSGRGTAGDPENRLLWHFPRRRLDLEAMRDTLLAVSGRLDVTMGGRSVDVAGDPANCRRTVYGLVDRQNLPGLFRSFDFAVPDQCVERRPKTTVPQQALFAMNSPFVMEQAQALAASVASLPDEASRAAALIRRVLGREPKPDELARARRFVAAAGSEDGHPPSPWEQFAQVLLASNELIFLD